MRNVWVIALLLAACGGAKPDPAVGLWKYQWPFAHSADLMDWTLDLRPDGAFHHHRDFRIMVRVVGEGEGKWRREGDRIRLQGEATEEVGDRDKLERMKVPLDFTFEFKGPDVLRLDESALAKIAKIFKPDGEMTFRRVAAGTSE